MNHKDELPNAEEVLKPFKNEDSLYILLKEFNSDPKAYGLYTDIERMGIQTKHSHSEDLGNLTYMQIGVIYLLHEAYHGTNNKAVLDGMP